MCKFTTAENPFLESYVPLSKEGHLLRNFMSKGTQRYTSKKTITWVLINELGKDQPADNNRLNSLAKFLLADAPKIAKEYVQRLEATRQLEMELKKINDSFNRKLKRKIKTVFGNEVELGLLFDRDTQFTSLYFSKGVKFLNQKNIPLRHVTAKHSEYGIFRPTAETGRKKSERNFYIQLAAAAICHETMLNRTGHGSLLSNSECAFFIADFLYNLPEGKRPKCISGGIKVDAVNELLDVKIYDSPVFYALLTDLVKNRYPFSLVDFYRRNHTRKENRVPNQSSNATQLRNLVQVGLEDLSEVEAQVPFSGYAAVLKNELGRFDANILNSDILRKWA